MGLQFILILGLAGCWTQFVASREHPDQQNDWSTFKATYRKPYPDGGREDLWRRSIFERNKREIQQHSNESKSYTRGLNQFSDLTEHELASILLVARGSAAVHQASNEQDSPEAGEFLTRLLGGNRSEPLPDSIDWRTASQPSRVTRIKNQQLCGSSWAFAATGLLEGQQLSLTKGKELIELSEQQFLDCNIDFGGCKGSACTADALRFISRQGGINDGKSYPYKAEVDLFCEFHRDKVVMGTKGPVMLPEGDEQTLKEVVAKYGPVAIRTEVTGRGFFQYREGVFKDDTCRSSSTYLTHSMLIVGYGRDEKQGDYWLVVSTTNHTDERRRKLCPD